MLEPDSLEIEILKPYLFVDSDSLETLEDEKDVTLSKIEIGP